LDAPILSTKLFIPKFRKDLVPRPRLFEKLNAGLDRKLTLISAPAGFGKSTLISDWIYQSKEDIVWLSLDENDNNQARFLTYLIAALNKAEVIEKSIGRGALEMLKSPQAPSYEGILTTLINEVAALSGNIILVLDDYHLIDFSPIDESLTFLFKNQPQNLHLIISTRDDPQLPLARLRARGQLSELRAADLRFTSSEVAEFLKDGMGLSLSVEDIDALESRTEGWIVGLQLAAISLQGIDDPSKPIKSFTGSHHFVLDYLIEEVLEKQSESVQTFLLKTSIVNRLTGSLCDALTVQDNGQGTLEMLEHANLFIIPLDNERHWYRYHHLFVELLRLRLRQSQPENLPILHIRASEWFNHQGLNREAIKHSLAANDYQGAAELIRAIAIDIIQQGEHATVAEWINAFPEEFIKGQSFLCVLHAWALHLMGEMGPADTRLIEAEDALDNLSDSEDAYTDTILGLIQSQRAYQAFMAGELDKTIHHAQKALEKLPETSTLIRTRTATYQSAAHLFKGQLHETLEIFNDILPDIQSIGGTSTATMCFLNLGDLYADMAQLHKAKETYEQALKLTERHKGRPDLPYTGYTYVRIGRIFRQWNQLEDAYHFTVKGLALCQEWNVIDVVALSYIEMAYILQTLGDEEKSQIAITEAIQTMESFSPFGAKHAAGHQAYINLRRGDLNAAERWTQTNDLSLKGDFEFHREIEYMTLARVLFTQNRFEEALSLHLEQALSIGEPEGYIRIFIDEGPPMEALLKKMKPEDGKIKVYVLKLLDSFSDKDSRPSSSTPQPQIEPLSERELDVLKLIAEGLTNPEIASRLFLSLNTIKVHTRNIYGKLGVTNRTKAAAKARNLEILPPT